MKNLFKVTPLKLSMLVALALAAVVFFQEQRQWTGWLPYRMELKLLDAKFAFRGPIEMEPQVVIAGADEKALEAFGVWGSWSRRVYARLIRNLFAAGADVVAFDMVWADELGEADSEQMRRVMLEYRNRNLEEVGTNARTRVGEAREKLKNLDDAIRDAEAAAAGAKGGGKGKRLQLALLALRDAHKQAVRDLEAAESAATTLTENAEGFTKVLVEEAGGTSPDQDLEDAIAEHATRIVVGYAAESAGDRGTEREREAAFERVRPAAMDMLYRSIKSVDASPKARLGRTLVDMCSEGKSPCTLGGEDVAQRAGMPEEEFGAAIQGLNEAKLIELTETGLVVKDVAALKALQDVGSSTTLVEWLPGSPDDRELEQQPGVMLLQGSFIAPLKRFAQAGQNFGFFNAEPDADGVFRKQPMLMRFWHERGIPDAAQCTACNRARLTPERFASMEDPSVCSEPCQQSCPECFLHSFYLPSLALAVVQQRFETTPAAIRDTNYPWLRAVSEVSLLPMEPQPKDKVPVAIKTDPSGRLILNYYGRWRDHETGKFLFPHLSVADIVANNFDPKAVKGKAVIFAATALGTYDQRSTPFDGFVPGVVIHATAIQNMVDGKNLTRPQMLVLGEMIFILLLGLLLGLIWPRIGVPAGFALFVALGIAYWLVDVYALFSRGLWVQSFWPYVQLLSTFIIVQGWGYLTVGREKGAMRKAFGAVLDPVLVDSLVNDPEALNRLKGDEREGTIMFSDIRGFTTLSENLTPEELTIFLNDYFTPQAAAIMNHKGYLDKYIGDAIMALFGAPSAFPDHAVAGCYAALDMMEQLRIFKKWVVSDPKWAAFCQRLLSKNMDPTSFDIGIGLNTGSMRVGFMGSSQKTNYSALGDSVNLASRLEGQTKEYGVHIIISESTYRIAMQGNRVHARLLDAIRVKGKKEPVKIYELIGRGEAPPEWGQFIKTFETGISLYLERRFSEAIPYFAQALREKPLDEEYEKELAKKRKPRDLISADYISRCMEYQENPPPPDWDGVVTKTSK